eukprot:m.67256 g.67256  ORF g.67256 m.67256 type:complete len:360 (+) comp23787_c0_seq1:66-1145(+)
MSGAYGGPISLDLPNSRLIATLSSFKNPKSDHEKSILGHHFNHAVEITVPGYSELPSELIAVSPTKDTFYVATFQLAQFLEPKFIQSFATGQLYALSLGTKIDVHNVAAVLPSGKLILSIDKPTYEQLGLQGKKTSFYGETRYNVSVDVTQPSFSSGNKIYERVKWCLTDRLGLKFEFLVGWRSNKEPATFECDVISNLPGAKKITPEEFAKSYSKLQIPKLPFAEEGLRWEDDILDANEWLGAISSHLDMCGSIDSYHNTLTCPTPTAKTTSLVTKRWRGFIFPQTILQIVKEASQLVDEKNLEWVAVNIWGFQDTPLSWDSQEHGFSLSGANNTTFVCYSGGRYLRLISLDPKDTMS